MMNDDCRQDELLDELRELDEIREQIWDECDRDFDKCIAMLQETRRQLLREGWVQAPPLPVRGRPAA
jgi:hypothetical protein